MYHHERRERRRRRLARRSLCSSRAAGFHHRATFSTTTTRHAHDASFVPRAQVATMAEAEAVPVPPAAPPADEPETCIPPAAAPGMRLRCAPLVSPTDRTTDRSDRSVDRAPSSRTLNRRAKRYPSADPSRDLTPPTPKKSNSRLRPPRIRRPDEPVRPAVELQAVQARQGGRGRRAAPADERGDERFRKNRTARRRSGTSR